GAVLGEARGVAIASPGLQTALVAACAPAALILADRVALAGRPVTRVVAPVPGDILAAPAPAAGILAEGAALVSPPIAAAARVLAPPAVAFVFAPASARVVPPGHVRLHR